MDHGESDNAFANKENKANISGATIDTAFTSDDTHYNVDGQTNHNGNLWESDVASITTRPTTNGFDFAIKASGVGYNTRVYNAAGKTNLFDFDNYVWTNNATCTATPNLATNSIRVKTTGGDAYVGKYENEGTVYMTLKPGAKYILSYSWYNHADEEVTLLPYVFYSKTNNPVTWQNGNGTLNSFGKTFTGKSGTHSEEFTVPDGMPYVTLRLGINSGAGEDVTFSDVTIVDTTDSSQFAKMNDIFVENIATGLSAGTYTVAFESSLRYDDYRWYAIQSNTYTNIPSMDWAHEKGTIQMFITTTADTDVDNNGENDGKMEAYYVPCRVTTDVSTGGTIATFTLPEGSNGNINLGFCITNDTALSGWVDNIRITEGEYVIVDEKTASTTLPSPTWTGYTFKGWAEKSSPFYGTLGTLASSGTPYTFGVESDTVIANWQINKYDVTFDNEFDFDLGWDNPAAGSFVEYNEDENYFRTKATGGDNYVLHKQYIDIVPGHTYRISYDYVNNDTKVSAGIQNHFFMYDANKSGQSWYTDGQDGFTGKIYYYNIGSSGTISYTILVPEGKEFAKFRVGTCSSTSADVTFSDIYIQDITRGTSTLVHDTSIGEPYFYPASVGSGADVSPTIVHGVVRNYKDTLGDAEMTELPLLNSDLFDFEGWKTDKNGTEVNVTLDDITEAKTNQKWSHWTVHLEYSVGSDCSWKDGYSTPESEWDIAIGSKRNVASYVPYKVGYNFKGWYCAIDDKTYNPGDEITLNHNVALTPVWEKATEAVKGTDYTNLTTLYPGQIYFYSYIPANNEYVSGYLYNSTEGLTLSRYQTGVDDPVAGVEPEENKAYGVSNVESIVSGALTGGTKYYYAITSNETAAKEVTVDFKLSEHYVNYHLNATGEGGSPDQDIVGHYNTAMTPSEPTRTGYTFMGWSETSGNNQGAKELTAAYTNGLIDGSKTFIVEKTLYAAWSINTYKLTVNAYYNTAASSTATGTTWELAKDKNVGGYVQIGNTESKNGTVSADVVFEKSATYQAVPATGYSFAGWYSNPTISNGVITDWGTPDAETAATVTIAKMGAANKTVYARFDINKYTVNISAWNNSSSGLDTYTNSATGGTVKLDDGVADAAASNSYVYGQTYTMTAEAKPGYQFIGWYDITSDITVNDGYNYNSNPVTVTVSENTLNYRARFDIVSQKLTVNFGAEEITESKEYSGYIGDTIAIPVPERDGYDFIGWEQASTPFYGSISGYNYIFGAGNASIIATWKAKTYNITVNPDGGSGDVRYYSGGGEQKTQTVSAETVIPMDYKSIATLGAPTKTGYEFEKWVIESGAGSIESGTTSSDSSEFTVGLGDAVVKATWKVLQYQLTVQAWGNTASSTDTYKLGIGGTVKLGEDGTSEEQVNTMVDFDKKTTIVAQADTGYTFAGWQRTAPTAQLDIISNESKFDTMGTEGLQYFAVFKINEYEVTLNKQYSTADAPNDFVDDTEGKAGTVTGDGSYYYGTNATLQATAKTGYTFNGWYDANNTLVSSNKDYAFAVTGDVNYTARFVVSRHTINTYVYANTAIDEKNFYENSAAGTITGGGEYYYGTKVKLEATAKTGYEFVGWYSDASLTNSKGTDAVLDITVTSTEGYYAKFAVVKVKVNLYAMSNADDLNSYTKNDKGGKVSYDGTNYAPEAENNEYYYSSTTEIYAKPETGYRFDGWYSEETLTTESIGQGTHQSDGSYVYNYTVKGDVAESLYAKFSVDSYSLKVYAYYNTGDALNTFNPGYVGGTVSIVTGDFTVGNVDYADSDGAYASIPVYYERNAKIKALAAYGYSFEGWYISITSDNNFAEDALFSNVDDASTAPMTASGLTYYAKFGVNSFKVAYNPNGGTGEPDASTAYYNTALTLSTVEPSKVGFLFEGWSINKDADTATYKKGVTIPNGTINDWYASYVTTGEEITLYAVWVANANQLKVYSVYSVANQEYRHGDKGGTAKAKDYNNTAEIDEAGNVIVPTGAVVQNYLDINPETGFACVQWRYKTTAPSFTTKGDYEVFEYPFSWGAPGDGQTQMPSEVLHVVVFFEIQTFSANAYAYYNTAAASDTYNYGATGGTVMCPTSEDSKNASNAHSDNQNYNMQVRFIATPAKGYEFTGWYKPDITLGDVVENWGEQFSPNADCLVTLDDTNKKGETANNYYAVFSIKSFNATASVRTYKVREDLIYSLGENNRPGGNPSNDGGVVGVGLTQTSDSSWKWTGEQVYSVTIGASDENRVYYGERVYFEAKANKGYVFGGWYSAKDAEYYGEALVEETELTYSRIMREGHIYMEAKFVPMSFTLVLEANGGTAGNPAEIVVTYGDDIEIESSSIPTKTGSTFLGWADLPSATVATYTIGTIPYGTVNQWFDEVYDEATGSVLSKTIYAVWSVAKVEITFDNQGATGGQSKVEIFVGATLPAVTPPTYDGFVFGGYYENADGTGTPYYNADGTSVKQWNSYSGITLYAKWSCPVLQNIEYDEAAKTWKYTYQGSETGGMETVESKDAVTTASEITTLAEDAETDILWWTLNRNTLNKSHVETQRDSTPTIDLNHYSAEALSNLLTAVKETDTEEKREKLTQPQANAYVAKIAKNIELDFEANRNTTEKEVPTVTLYENAKNVATIKGKTINKENGGSANGSTYSTPPSEDSASYTYAGKWSYTANDAVDYYLYTNSPNPVIALEIGDGDVATTVEGNASSYPTKATITDNAAGYSYVNGGYHTSAVKATDNLDEAWFTQYTTAKIGTAHDYNAKTVIYLTPEFTASGTQNEIVYTISASDDAYVANQGISDTGISGTDANMIFESYRYDAVEAEQIEKDDPSIDRVNDITVCICYHNSMNGESDEGTLDASGTYMQMYMDQVNQDEWLNQLHLFRTSGGAFNWDFPTTTESVYPVEDSTYPYSEISCTLGSFIYVFDETNEEKAANLAASGDYTGAKQAIIDSVKGKAGEARSAISDRSNKLNLNGNSEGLGYVDVTTWSVNFYPKTGSYVYAHLVDRWGNVFNRVWKCFNVDSYPSKINGIDGAAVYNVFEDGGSNINTVTLDGANVEFILDDNSTYENGVFTTTGNTVTLSTGEANKTYNLTIVDNATNTNTVAVTTDGDGVLVLNVEDACADLSSGAYTFTLNGETVNLYAGVEKLIYSADITEVSMVGEETVITVKTSDDVLKLQLVENGGTRTYNRDAADSVVENEDGTLTWTISFKTTKGAHAYDLKAKTINGWETTEYVLETEIIEEYVSTPIVLKSVENATASVGEKPVIKARTQVGTQKLQIVYESGATITYNRSDDIVITTVDDVETWALTASAYGKAGEYSVKVRAKYNGEWQTDNAKTSTITVTEKVVDTTPVIYSVEAQADSAKVGELVTFEVVTNSNAVKVRFNYPDGGTWTFSEADGYAVDNGNGTKTWTVSVKFYSVGERDINFSTRSVDGWIDGQSFGTIEVTK